MKKFIITSFALCIAISSFSLSPNSESMVGDGTIPIRVIKGTNNTNKPKAPARIPVRALYLSSASSIQVTFNYDVGNVDISVSNEATGESVSYDVDSQTGLCILPISGDTGLWSITFTLESGVQYQGEFSVL